MSNTNHTNSALLTSLLVNASDAIELDRKSMDSMAAELIDWAMCEDDYRANLGIPSIFD